MTSPSSWLPFVTGPCLRSHFRANLRNLVGYILGTAVVSSGFCYTRPHVNFTTDHSGLGNRPRTHDHRKPEKDNNIQCSHIFELFSLS